MTKKIWTVLLAAGATAVWAGPFSVAAQETETLTEYTMETLHVASEETERSKETELLEETEFSEKAELSEEERQEYVSAYRDALETFLQDQMLPDKTTQWSLVEGMGEMEENSFAISDVDSDGVPELVLHLVTAPMAGMLEGIYQYDPQTKELKEELLGFTSAEYYEGGLLKMWWSHNQGLAGDSFWPYTIFEYDTESGTYEFTANVDAWDKTLSETDYEGNTYPEDVDKEGAGIVYLITEKGEDDKNQETVMDKKTFEAWEFETFDPDKILEIPYKAMTEEEIAAIQP